MSFKRIILIMVFLVTNLVYIVANAQYAERAQFTKKVFVIDRFGDEPGDTRRYRYPVNSYSCNVVNNRQSHVYITGDHLSNDSRNLGFTTWVMLELIDNARFPLKNGLTYRAICDEFNAACNNQIPIVIGYSTTVSNSDISNWADQVERGNNVSMENAIQIVSLNIKGNVDFILYLDSPTNKLKFEKCVNSVNNKESSSEFYQAKVYDCYAKIAMPPEIYEKYKDR